MKRTLLLSFGLALLSTAGWSVSAFGQTTNPAPNQQQPPATGQQQTPATGQNPAATPQQAPVPAEQQARPVPGQQQTRQIQGRVIRTGENQVIVQTPDKKEVTINTHPRTTYRLKNRDVRFSDVRVGTNITAGYDLDGTRYLANNVVVVPAEPAVGVTAEPVVPAEGTFVQGRVMRVVGTDQVIIQTPDGKEVIVYVSPQTAYQLSPQGGVFTDLRPGVDIGVNYDVRANRFLARRIARRNNR
jgi:hypothetical protein